MEASSPSQSQPAGLFGQAVTSRPPSPFVYRDRAPSEILAKDQKHRRVSAHAAILTERLTQLSIRHSGLGLGREPHSSNVLDALLPYLPYDSSVAVGRFSASPILREIFLLPSACASPPVAAPLGAARRLHPHSCLARPSIITPYLRSSRLWRSGHRPFCVRKLCESLAPRRPAYGVKP